MRELSSIPAVNAVEPVPGTDAIEKLRVLGRWVVAEKGEHQPGPGFSCAILCAASFRNSR